MSRAWNAKLVTQANNPEVKRYTQELWSLSYGVQPISAIEWAAFMAPMNIYKIHYKGHIR